MRLAKPRVDVGLATNQPEEHLAFWQGLALPFDARLPIGPNQVQHRFDANGSILKVNGFVEPLPAGPRGGYREVLIAQDGLDRPRGLADPDGSRVSLVPKGFEGVHQIGVRLAVRDLAAHRRFYAETLRLPEEEPGRFRAGETLILLKEDPQAAPDASLSGPGWRYITFQVFKADEEHAHALATGAREARAPVTLGDVARFSIIRDPDGNAIELSQRASLVGSLD
jgi:catechol 2,3-dioxygenase-like lactoylglutathione lyase family enzyme